jgi:L-aminopeptidase/D-esterase-like protein
VAEGNVGGGTGMILHEFKGGIGTASRLVPEADGGWTVGALVQGNYGSRGLLRVDGVGPLLVLTTTTGSAGALAAALDHEEWPGILGTIAGDDTLLVVAKSVPARTRLARRFRELLRAAH